jgi:hypothetical protein
VNPHTIAVYPGGKGENGYPAGRRSDFETQKCPLTSGLSDTNRGAIDLDCFKFPEDGRYALDPAYAHLSERYAYDLAAGTGDEAVHARNRLAAILMKHADDVCTLEKGRLVATESSANGLLSFLTSAFAGASTVVGGEQAKTILGGLAGLSNATRANVNETFYRNQLTQAINKVLDEERNRIRTQIDISRGKALTAYTVDDMILQVNAYHHGCSFERGLQLLIDAALDKSGAEAVLEARSRSRAIADLERHLITLRRQLAADPASETINKQIEETLGDLHGLRMAAVKQGLADPAAGEAAGGGATDRPPSPVAPGEEKNE